MIELMERCENGCAAEMSALGGAGGPFAKINKNADRLESVSKKEGVDDLRLVKHDRNIQDSG